MIDQCHLREACPESFECINTSSGTECVSETDSKMEKKPPKPTVFEDRDECSHPISPCGENQVCENIDGGFLCIDITTTAPATTSTTLCPSTRSLNWISVRVNETTKVEYISENAILIHLNIV